LLQDGKIRAGIALEDQIPLEAQPLAQRLVEALAQLQSRLPDLYSTREDAVLIGSNIDEVFHAAAIRDFMQEIASLPLKFAVRGGIRSAVAADGCTAWLATHVDLIEGPTIMPYRFLYIWLREQGEWRIVISHDAISIDPFNPGFDAP
jgi:ketosteroid isomerase-like protein